MTDRYLIKGLGALSEIVHEESGLPLAAHIAEVAGESDAVGLTQAEVDARIVVERTATRTVTNMRKTSRVVQPADAATVTPNADTTDVCEILALSQATEIANPTGTPTNKQMLQMDITTASAQTLTFGAQYEATALALPAATQGGGVTESYLWQWRAATSKWRLIAVNLGA